MAGMQRQRVILALGLLVLGSLLAWFVQTGGGEVDVWNVQFAGTKGNTIDALLYAPEGVNRQHKAPGILAIHGYINSKETQSGFAIEFARRGFVVLAPDETGHGYSSPPAFADGFGGPPALAYLRSLPFVDTHRIGLEGHSMGGWAVLMAAASRPNGYRSMVLEGSSTGTFGTPKGTPTFPRDLLLVESKFDEFSQLMWGSPVPANVVKTKKLKTLFDTGGANVVPGRLYGDIDKGTARKLLMPAVTHPGDHLSREAIGDAVAWFQKTLNQPTAMPPSNQIWYWKSFGTLVALIGLTVLMFPVIDWLLGLRWFRDVVVETPRRAGPHGSRLALNAAVACFVPVLTFFPLQAWANSVLPANALLPQQITNGVLLWAWGTGLIMLALFWPGLRRASVTLAAVGMPLDKDVVIRSAAIAVVCCGILYVIALLARFVLDIDFRFWVIALKTMSATQAVMFLIYLVPFTVFFVVLSLTLHAALGRRATLAGEMWVNAGVLSVGFVLMLAIQYTPLLLGGTLLVPQPLLSIVGFQFVPMMFLVGLVSTFCYARTGSIYSGAFVNALFVTWYLVAGTATQATPFWY